MARVSQVLHNAIGTCQAFGGYNNAYTHTLRRRPQLQVVGESTYASVAVAATTYGDTSSSAHITQRFLPDSRLMRARRFVQAISGTEFRQ